MPPSFRPLARRGFMLPAILILAILVGGLAVMFHERTRHRDVQVKRGRDRAIAKYLARAGIEWAKFSLREASRLEAGNPDPDLESGPLLPFLLDRSERIVEKVETRTAEKDDHRDLLEQLVTPAAYESLDRLEKRHPGSKIRLRVEVSTTSLGHSEVVSDPVLKTVVMKVTSEASMGAVTEAFRIEEPIWVHSNLPRAASRFTLSILGNDARETGQHRIDADGAHVEGDAPVVLYHHPDDGDPLDDEAFTPSGVKGEPMKVEVASPDDLMKQATGRGMVFLTGSEPDNGLPLAGSANPFGEDHLLGITQVGASSAPRFLEVMKVPEAFGQFRPEDPDHPGARQAAGLESLVTPFGAGSSAPGGPQLPLEWVSRLKLYGTPKKPSPTVVVGGASRLLGLYTRVGMDRDASDADETQQATSGAKLPRTEALGSYLPPVSESDLARVLADEAAGRPNFSVPAPFPVLTVPNRNRMADTDGDGTPETPVAGEEPFDPLRPAPGQWLWMNLFKDPSEYALFMSRTIQVPANAFLHLCRMSRPEVLERLVATYAGGQGDPALEAYRLKDPVIHHEDSLHAKLGKEPSVYLDGRNQDPSMISSAIGDGMQGRHPGDFPIQVRGQKVFEEHFMKGGQLDLDGLWIHVAPEDVPNPPPLLEFEQKITVKPGSGGLLSTPLFKAPGLTNDGTAGGFAPLVVQVDRLELTDVGPYEASFLATSLSTNPDKPRGVIRGNLVTGSLPSPLISPLVVQYDTRLDPTAATAPCHYRLAFPARSSRTYEYLGDTP